MNSPIEKYNQRALKINSLVCVGLDADLAKIPERFQKLDHPQFEFNKWIIDQTHEFAAAYKPNPAFYQARGAQGWTDLKLTFDFLKKELPDIFTICDSKLADIGSSNESYTTAIFDHLDADAITLHPYLGKEALRPFLEREDKVSIILCRTSNPGAGELQDLKIGEKSVWKILAEKIKNDWNEHNNCMLVVGATYPEELAQIRQLTGDMTFLVPGAGAQGGSVEAVMKVGLNSQGLGLIINSARDIIFAENPAQAARELREEINRFRSN